MSSAQHPGLPSIWTRHTPAPVPGLEVLLHPQPPCLVLGEGTRRGLQTKLDNKIQGSIPVSTRSFFKWRRDAALVTQTVHLRCCFGHSEETVRLMFSEDMG